MRQRISPSFLFFFPFLIEGATDALPSSLVADEAGGYGKARPSSESDDRPPFLPLMTEIAEKVLRKMASFPPLGSNRSKIPLFVREIIAWGVS